VTSAPATQQIDAFRRVFDALFELLGWTFGVALAGSDRAAFQQQVLTSWPHPDGTVPQLFAYLGGLHTAVFSQTGARRDRYRPEVRRLLARIFAAADPTERGRVLALLHQLLEHARPGSTGVAAPSSPLSAAVPPPAPLQPAPGQAPGHPPASGAAPGHGMAAPHGYGMPPGQQLPPGAPGGGPPVAAPGIPSQGVATVPELQQMAINEQIRQQQLMTELNIWNMRHNTAMKIIDSMR
jgi:hypothetical protein